jgi:hypothetical protein
MSNNKRFAAVFFSTLVVLGSAFLPASAQSTEVQPRWRTLIALRDQGAIFPSGSLTTSEKFWLAIGMDSEVRAAQGLQLTLAEKRAVRITFDQPLNETELALMGL